MSAAFDRGKRGNKSIYVPMQNGALVQRSTGTADASIARKMKRMVEQLRDEHRWVFLEAVRAKKIDLRTLYTYHASNQLGLLEGVLSAKNLSEHLSGWITWVRANRREGVRTADVYWQQVTTLVPHEGTFPASELTKARVVAWLAGLTCTSGTRRKYLYALKSFIHYLIDVGVLETDPLAGLRAPKKNPARERWETADRDRAIVAAASPQYRALFAFIKATGCDVGSARRAQLSDLDLVRGTVNLRGTKTDHRRVFRAWIEPWALPYLKWHVKDKVGPHTPLFEPFTNSGAGHHHAHVCSVLKVEDYTLKDARHSVAVRMRLAGATFEAIAEQLGTSVYQVVQVYSKYRPEMAATTTGSAT